MGVGGTNPPRAKTRHSICAHKNRDWDFTGVVRAWTDLGKRGVLRRGYPCTILSFQEVVGKPNIRGGDISVEESLVPDEWPPPENIEVCGAKACTVEINTG